MKLKKWTIGIVVMTGLLIGGLFGGVLLGGLPGRAAAAPMAAPAAQTTDQCVEDDDSAEAADTEDVDNVEEQCGPQDENEADEASVSSAADCANQDDDSAEVADTEDTDNVEEEVQCDPQDENETDEASSAGEEAEDGNETVDTTDDVAPSNLGITAVQAQTIVETANPNTTTLAVEFDQENGKDIWEVELDNGLDVKLDANSGQILLAETRD